MLTSVIIEAFVQGAAAPEVEDLVHPPGDREPALRRVGAVLIEMHEASDLH